MKDAFAVIGFIVIVLWALGKFGVGDFSLFYTAPGATTVCAPK